MYPDALIGKVLTAIYLADDKQAIKFDIDGVPDPLVVLVDAECCSQSWIENIENPEAAVGAEIIAAANIPMPDLTPDDKSSDNGDVTAYYGFQIRTAKGDCVLDYRNASNGYYGGSLVWPGEHFYGGVFDQNNSKQVWNRVA